MPDIGWVSCIYPFDCSDPEKWALSSVPCILQAGPGLSTSLSASKANTVPWYPFAPRCSEDVTTCLTNRELSHQFTHEMTKKHKILYPEQFGQRRLCSEQITSILLKNYSSSRMQWHSFCHQLKRVRNVFENCPRNLSLPNEQKNLTQSVKLHLHELPKAKQVCSKD